MGDDKLFCFWFIIEVEKWLLFDGFIWVYCSYLINLFYVSGFEWNKDNGMCYFDEVVVLIKVLVSRLWLNVVRDVFGVQCNLCGVCVFCEFFYGNCF